MSEEIDEAIEISPFSLNFDATDGFVDFRPQVQVVDPKESVVVPSVEPPIQVQEELPPPPQEPVTPTATESIQLPPIPKVAPKKTIIIPNAH